jgi:bis(5'-nucleosyl)-tetraphosphatase (symmetrical)
MAVYAIGDLQGCLDSFKELLDKLALCTGDTIWLTGDLVNRGPQSLETLRFVKNLDALAVTVLGNHDLHLLALDAGRFAEKPNPTLQPILNADDREELLDWLRHRPLFHVDDKLGWAMAHAGIHPQWNISLAEELAREAEALLGGDGFPDFMLHMYGNHPDNWDPGLSGYDRIRFIVNVFTRIRFCSENGGMDFIHKGPIGSQGEDLYPWFAQIPDQALSHRLVFGHWSALGRGGSKSCFGIDTGCLWGGRLTALRIDHEQPYEISVPCPQHEKVHG